MLRVNWSYFSLRGGGGGVTGICIATQVALEKEELLSHKVTRLSFLLTACINAYRLQILLG